MAYQSLRIHGNDYASNDLRAIAADLRLVTEAGFKVVPLRWVVDAWLENRGGELNGKFVAFTCDKGADFDALDLPHPTVGAQRSVLNILRDFASEFPGRQEALNVTSFVVASPEARTTLDSACLIGRGWWTHSWWRDAISSGLMHIANHSWDHNHELLDGQPPPGVTRGTFSNIRTKELADEEIARAAHYLRDAAPNPGLELFAYPYGESNEYLANEYFPCHGGPLGLRAAVTTRAGFLEPGCQKWEIPRFLFGRDWRSPSELRALLEEAAAAGRKWVPARVDEIAASPQGAERAKDASGSMSEDGFRARYTEVPKILSEWLEVHRKLDGLDILDFGCGPGITALGLALSHRPRRVVGVDIGTDPELCLPLAKHHIGLDKLPDNLALHRVTPGLLHDSADRFDVAYSWSVFEHVDERLVDGVLDLIRSSLKPDGLLLVQIAPLFYSAEGAHLASRLQEPWVHLLTQQNLLYEKLAASTHDKKELEALWGTYATLNRITAPELLDHVERGGFEILRVYTTKDERPVPARLAAIFREDVLITSQVALLGRRC